MCKAPRLPAAPVYGGNNWCYAYGKSSTDDIRQDSERIASLASSANNKPFMVMQLKNTGRQIADLERCSLPAQRILLKWALSIAASCPAPASYLVAKLGGWSNPGCHLGGYIVVFGSLHQLTAFPIPLRQRLLHIHMLTKRQGIQRD
jgi:hypothetical protein